MQHNICNHKTCDEIRKRRNSKLGGGIGIAYIVNYNHSGQYAIMLGKERFGAYKNMYSLCSGKLDPCDNNCYIKAAKRESGEEFKIDIQDKKIFDTVFKNSNGKTRFIMHNGTPILIGVINGVSRKQINPLIEACNNNAQLDHSLKEMSKVDYFWLQNGQQIEGKKSTLSGYASAIISKIDVNKL